MAFLCGLKFSWSGMGARKGEFEQPLQSHSSNSASLSKGQGKAVRLFLVFAWMSLGITSATLNQNSQQPVFMSSQRPHFSLLRRANMSQLFCFLATTSCGNWKNTPRVIMYHVLAGFLLLFFVSCMQVFFVATLCSYINSRSFLASLLMVFTIRFLCYQFELPWADTMFLELHI